MPEDHLQLLPGAACLAPLVGADHDDLGCAFCSRSAWPWIDHLDAWTDPSGALVVTAQPWATRADVEHSVKSFAAHHGLRGVISETGATRGSILISLRR